MKGAFLSPLEAETNERYIHKLFFLIKIVASKVKEMKGAFLSPLETEANERFIFSFALFFPITVRSPNGHLHYKHNINKIIKFREYIFTHNN